MGQTSYGIFIKLKNRKEDSKSSCEKLFGEIREISNPPKENRKYNKLNYLYVSEYNNGIIISNPGMVDKLIFNIDNEFITQIKSNAPDYEYILSFAQYSATDSCGIRFIDKSRHSDRLVSYGPNEIILQYGDPLDEELKYLNGNYFRDDQEGNRIILQLSKNDNPRRLSQSDAIWLLTSELISKYIHASDIGDQKTSNTERVFEIVEEADGQDISNSLKSHIKGKKNQDEKQNIVTNNFPTYDIRVLAFSIDFILYILSYKYLIMPLLNLFIPLKSVEQSTLLISIIDTAFGRFLEIFVFGILCHAILESTKYQATIGKYLLGIKVAKYHYYKIGHVNAYSFRRLSLSESFLRNSGKIISALICFLGFLVPLVSKRKQALHDIFVNTTVINSKINYT